MKDVSGVAYYYLHENGKLIYKPSSVVDFGQTAEEYFSSPYIVKWWRIDLKTPDPMVKCLREAKDLGVKREDIMPLVKLWGVDERKIWR